MNRLHWPVVLFALIFAAPLHSQGLTLTLKEIGPAGQTTPTLQADATHARLDIPSMITQVLYNAPTKTMQVLVPLLRGYREYTPATVQQTLAAPPAPGAQPAEAPIRYMRTGTSKVGNWNCTTYDGFRGAEKVVEVCAAESPAIALTAADFTVALEAINMIKTVAAPGLIERIPVYGTAGSQGFAGFPVRRVSYRNGKPDVTTELVDIKREAVPAATFALPAGYTKIQIP